MQAELVYGRYVELLKATLLNELNPENGLRISYLLERMDTSRPYDIDRSFDTPRHEQATLERLREDSHGEDNSRARIAGFPLTMIGRARLDNLQHCVETVVREGVVGWGDDLYEGRRRGAG